MIGRGHTAPQRSVLLGTSPHEVTLRDRFIGPERYSKKKVEPAGKERVRAVLECTHQPISPAYTHTLAEALAGAGWPARGVAEGPLKTVVLLGQLLDGLLQVDTLLLFIIQSPLPFPAVSLG